MGGRGKIGGSRIGNWKKREGSKKDAQHKSFEEKKRSGRSPWGAGFERK